MMCFEEQSEKMYIMKKALKIYGGAWIAAIAFPLISFLILFCFERVVGSDELEGVRELADDPTHIENIISIDLPATYHVDSKLNSDEKVNIYSYNVQFSEDLSDNCIEELEDKCVTDKLHWSKGEGFYRYHLHPEASRFDISCLIYSDHYELDYAVFTGMSQSASVRAMIYMALVNIIITLSGIIFGALIAWGIVLLIIAQIRKRKGN